MIFVNDYAIDAAVREEHGGEAEVTMHPVERGADITDHIRRKARTLRIEGVVSDAPIGDVAALRTETTLPSVEALQRLEEFLNSRETVQVITGIRSYESMVLTQLSIPRDAATGEALAFSATFVELMLAEVGRAVVAVPVRPRGKAKVNKGNKAAGEADKPRNVSVLKQALGGVGFDTGAFARGD